MGTNYDFKTDVWSVGCVIFKTLTSNDLFYPKVCPKYTLDENHISQIIKVFGELSTQFTHRSQKSRVKIFYKKLFTNKKFSRINRNKLTSIEEVLIEEYKIAKTNAKWIGGFLRPIMHPDPFKRKSALEALKNQWVTNLNSPRGSLYMALSEWHDSIWNRNIVEDVDTAAPKTFVGSDKEEADIGEFDSNESEVSFGKFYSSRKHKERR